FDQRYIPVPFTVEAGSLVASAPASANIAPPGYYMLFIVNSAGVPSVARFVHIG
ncbi:MAG TPA: galactose oxidase early set domain-containing protein, partial [Actinomycetota bacterium]